MMEPIDTITVSHIEDIIDHQITVKESGKYQVNILGTTVNGITARKAYEATEIALDIKQWPELEPDLKRTNYAWLWILISCIATIAVIVLIVQMVKYIKDKQESNQEMANPFDGIIE